MNRVQIGIHDSAHFGRILPEQNGSGALYSYRNHLGGDRNRGFPLAVIFPARLCVSYNRITTGSSLYGPLCVLADMRSFCSIAVLSTHHAEAESRSGSCWRCTRVSRSCVLCCRRARCNSLEPGSGRPSPRLEERGVKAFSIPVSSLPLTHQTGRHREPSLLPPLLPDSAAAHSFRAIAAAASTR